VVFIQAIQMIILIITRNNF